MHPKLSHTFFDQFFTVRCHEKAILVNFHMIPNFSFINNYQHFQIIDNVYIVMTQPGQKCRLYIQVEAVTGPQ